VADIIEEKTTIIEDFNGSFEFFVDCSKDRAKIAERLQEWMENPPSCLTAFSSVAKQSMGFSDENSEDKITIVSPICE